jgi:hypothetical protein
LELQLQALSSLKDMAVLPKCGIPDNCWQYDTLEAAAFAKDVFVGFRVTPREVELLYKIRYASTRSRADSAQNVEITELEQRFQWKLTNRRDLGGLPWCGDRC